MKIFIAAIVAFIAYHCIVFLPGIKNRILRKSKSCSFTQHVFQRLAGFLILGLIPFYYLNVYDMYQINDSVNLEIPAVIITLALCMLVVFINNKHTSNADNLVNHPRIKVDVWSKNMRRANVITWIAFLAAYEWLLRGVLLSSSTLLMPVWFAIAVNVFLYALMHCNSKEEALGSIPFGIVLCLLTLYSHSIYPAIILHCTFAVSFESYCIKRKAVIVKN